MSVISLLNICKFEVVTLIISGEQWSSLARVPKVWTTRKTPGLFSWVAWSVISRFSCQLPDVQAGFRKGRETRDQIVNICWIIEKARAFQKNIYFCFTDYVKAFDYVKQSKLKRS